jgi:hypothetical protein
MYFMPINSHGRGRTDAQANPVAVNGGHDDSDLIADHDLFTDAPTEH